MIVKTNTNQRESCNRDNCMICRFKPSYGACKKSSVTYKITCRRYPCWKEVNGSEEQAGTNRPALYYGETYKTAFLRGTEHEGGYRDQSDTSVLYLHSIDCHGGEFGPEGGIWDYQMEVVKSFYDPMSRQVAEGTKIRWLEGEELGGKAICLNSRLDWLQSAKMKMIANRRESNEYPTAN